MAAAKAGVDVLYVLTGVSERREISKAMNDIYTKAKEEAFRPGMEALQRMHEAEGEAVTKNIEDARRSEMEALQDSVKATRDSWTGQGERAIQEVDRSKLNNFTLVRRFDIGLSDGARLIPVENAEADHIAVSRSWLRKHNMAADLCVLVKVNGDSMSPTIPGDSLVLVDISDMRSTREGIYDFRRDGEAYIKRLVPVGVTEDDKPAALVIVSDNPSIFPETISGERLADIRIVGRVRCVIADL